MVIVPVAWSNTTWSAVSLLAAEADQPRAAVIPKTVVDVRPVARILPMVAWRLVEIRAGRLAVSAASRSLRSVVIVIVLLVAIVVMIVIVVLAVVVLTVVIVLAATTTATQ